MVLFINFAPIEFMGGVERRIYSLYSFLQNKGGSKVVCVSPFLANIYGRIVLNREFSDHLPKSYSHILKHTIYIDLLTFVPFTQKWQKMRQIIRDAEIIYCKYELNEAMILAFFGGVQVFKKTIAAIRSPFIYKSPVRLLDKVHNYVYESALSINLLRRFSVIHVLNPRDLQYFKNDLKIKNVIQIPNGIELKQVNITSRSKKNNVLRVIFVGDLSVKKGVDLLIKIIKQSPQNYHYDIVGDGTLKNKIVHLEKSNKHVTYHGYQNGKNLNQIYQKGDVFLFPSRAETFGTVMIEAAYYGNVILNSNLIRLNLPSFIETSTKSNKETEYLNELNTLYKIKKSGKLPYEKIHEYIKTHYSNNKISNEIYDRLITSI